MVWRASDIGNKSLDARLVLYRLIALRVARVVAVSWVASAHDLGCKLNLRVKQQID